MPKSAKSRHKRIKKALMKLIKPIIFLLLICLTDTTVLVGQCRFGNNGDLAQLFFPSFKLRNVKTGKYLAIGAGIAERGIQAIQWEDSGQKDIIWTFDLSYCSFTNFATCFDLGAKNNKVVQLKDDEVTGYLQSDECMGWEIIKHSGKNRFKSKCTGKFLGIEGGSTANGAKAVLVSDGGQELLWEIVPFKDMVKKVKITIITGGDDLRARSTLNLKIGTYAKQLLAGNSSFPGGSTKVFNITLPAESNVSAESFDFVLEHDGSPRSNPLDTYDNWDMNKFKVEYTLFTGRTVTVFESWQPIRFTGGLRTQKYKTGGISGYCNY
jgi:hypothetical protein